MARLIFLIHAFWQYHPLRITNSNFLLMLPVGPSAASANAIDMQKQLMQKQLFYKSS
jgi:hypothetical protein